MNSDTRLASGGNSRSKRRLPNLDEDSRSNPATDESIANPKRQRVSRACDSCRSKKDKCDGAQPVCSTCASLSRPCTYKANPKKRGLPTGYIRTLELMWALVFTKIQGSEEVVRVLLRAANIPSHLASMGKEAEGSDTLLSTWKNSIVLKEIERLLTFLEQPDDEQQERLTRGAGQIESPLDVDGNSVLSSDALEWQIPDSLEYGREGSLATGLSPAKTPTTAFNTRQAQKRNTRDSATQTISPTGQSRQLPTPLVDKQLSQSQVDLHSATDTQECHAQFPHNPWPLLDIYFSYTQCWFPILEKHDILRTAFRQAEGGTSVSNSSAGSGDYAALWAALALASLQEMSIAKTRQSAEFSGDLLDPAQLYAKAKSLIPEENGVHEIGHTQALLILSLIKIGQQDWAAAWILVGQAVRIAQNLGLNNPRGAPTSTTEEAKTAGRSKHVFLGCFILETLVAMQSGQVPSLRRSDLTKVGPINEDGLEEWHPWEDQTSLRPVESSRKPLHRGPLHALSTFNRLLSLMCILNDLCCWSQSVTNSISHLEALERQLQIWVSALPRGYRVDLQSNSARPTSPHIFGLEMMYEGIVAAINLPLSLQRGDINTQNCVLESSKRLISLLQLYMETYSLSATCPTFGMILNFCTPSTSSKAHAGWSSEVYPGLKSKLETFSAHLASVWSMDAHSISGGKFGPVTSTLSAIVPQRNLYNGNSNIQSVSRNPANDSRGLASVEDCRSRASDLSIPESYLSAPWMRLPSTNDDNVAISLPTPAPSLNVNPGPNIPHQTIPHSKEALSHHHHRHPSASGRPTNGAGVMSDLTTQFQTTTPQYQRSYNDPSLRIAPLVDINGCEPLNRPRIAPDLDALFDELASLDGTDRVDNQPEFMQNLGYLPETGIPDLYTYTGQAEPFLLSQSQPSLTSPEASLAQRESQPTNDSILHSSM